MTENVELEDKQNACTSAVGNDYPYLNNVSADPRLLGLATLLNPFAADMSSQRGTMFSNHIAQALIIRGHEQPKIFSGFEAVIGEYEHDTTHRDQDVQILDIVEKYHPNLGSRPIKNNPQHTIIYQGVSDGVVSYFNLDKHQQRIKGFGYPYVWNTAAISQYVQQNAILPKEVKLVSSPARVGNCYELGTNVKTAYMSLPGVTEDAFIISESTAKKLTSDGYSSIALEINLDQLPLNLYGDEEEYRFFPDIGEVVKDGILCAFRKPTQDSIVYDTAPQNLSTIQDLHDDVYYIPEGAEIIDVDVVINPNSAGKYSEKLFEQLDKYRDGNVEYATHVYSTYLVMRQQGKRISEKFNTLVTKAMETLILNGENLPGMARKNKKKLIPYKKKKPIAFAHVVISYRYTNTVHLGFKMTGRYGNKGCIAAIYPDEMMPVDAFGNRAGIIVDGVSVFNRMNSGQWYEQFLNAAADQVRITRIEPLVKAGKYQEAYACMLEFLADVNHNWAEIVDAKHTDETQRRTLMDEVIATKTILISIPPFLKHLSTKEILQIRDKWGIIKTDVEFGVKLPDGSFKKTKSCKPVLIGDEYWYCLCKIPHQKCSGIGYVNQFACASKPSALTKLQMPFSRTAIRLGEDEVRNIELVAGDKTAARVLGMYSNNKDAVNALGLYLLENPSPSKLKRLPIDTVEMANNSAILGIVKHYFSCTGINMATTVDDIPADKQKFILRADRDQDNVTNKE